MIAVVVCLICIAVWLWSITNRLEAHIKQQKRMEKSIVQWLQDCEDRIANAFEKTEAE